MPVLFTISVWLRKRIEHTQRKSATVTPLENSKQVSLGSLAEEEERRNGRNSHAAPPNRSQSSAKSRLPRIICSPKRYCSPSRSTAGFYAVLIFIDGQSRSQRVLTFKNGGQEAQQGRAHRVLRGHPGRHCQGRAQGAREDEEAVVAG